MLNAIYNSMLSDMTKPKLTRTLWLSKVIDLLDQNVFSEIWYNPNSIQKDSFIPTLKRKLTANFIVELRRGLDSSTSMTLYRETNTPFDLQSYLLKNQNSKQRQALSKLRLSYVNRNRKT